MVLQSGVSDPEGRAGDWVEYVYGAGPQELSQGWCVQAFVWAYVLAVVTLCRLMVSFLRGLLCSEMAWERDR